MQKKYDLVISTGKYMSGGKEKNRWKTIGSIMEKDDGGEFILLDRTFNPAGVPNPENRDSVLVSKFEVKDKNEPETHKGMNKDGDVPNNNVLNDQEIPF